MRQVLVVVLVLAFAAGVGAFWMPETQADPCNAGPGGPRGWAKGNTWPNEQVGACAKFCLVPEGCSLFACRQCSCSFFCNGVLVTRPMVQSLARRQANALPTSSRN